MGGGLPLGCMETHQKLEQPRARATREQGIAELREQQRERLVTGENHTMRLLRVEGKFLMPVASQYARIIPLGCCIPCTIFSVQKHDLPEVHKHGGDSSATAMYGTYQ